MIVSITQEQFFFITFQCSNFKESDKERALGMQLVAQLVGDGTINSTHCLEAVNKVKTCSVYYHF